MAIDLDDIGDDARAFLRERHLASLTVLREDGSPHVTPVGFSYDDAARLARVITFAGATKVRHLGHRSRVALSQVDGPRWLTLEGEATVTADPDRVAVAERGFAERYRPPHERDDRRAIEIRVDRIMGRA